MSALRQTAPADLRGTGQRAPAGSGPLTGLATLLRFMLRRDRAVLPAWVFGTALLGLYLMAAVETVAGSEQDLTGLAVMMDDPTMRLLTGPGYVDGAGITQEAFFAGGYLLYVLLIVALMNIFLIARHTRSEEQTGRAEMVRANVVGRHATSAAALSLLTGANLVVGVLLVGAGTLVGFPAAGTVLVGSAAAATGMVFAAAAACAAQVFAFSRAASGAVGALLGVMFLVRGAGDIPSPGGSWVSWLSPLAWAQQTAPYVHDRAWPLLLSIGLSLVLIVLAFRLSVARDLGAGMVAPRPGPAQASAGLGTPLGLAHRILRGTLRGWGAAILLWAVVMVSMVESMRRTAQDMPAMITQLLPPEHMVDSYLGMTALLTALLAGAAVVAGMQHVLAEEPRGRAESVLAAPVSRVRWLASHLTVLSGGLLVLVTAAGLVCGGIAAAQLGEADRILQVTMAFLQQMPAVLAVAGAVTLAFGWMPRILGILGWSVVGFGLFASFVGQALELPEAVEALSVFGHLAELPVEDFDAAPFWWLTAAGLLGMVLGVLGFRRRQVGA